MEPTNNIQVTNLRTLSYLTDVSTPSPRDYKKVDDAVLQTGSVVYLYEARNSQILVSAPLILLHRNFVVHCTPQYTLINTRHLQTIRFRFVENRMAQRNGSINGRRR